LLFSEIEFFHKGDLGPYWRSGLDIFWSFSSELKREARLKIFVEEMDLVSSSWR